MYTAEDKREIGELYFLNDCFDKEKRDYGLKLIIEAHIEKDPEATFIVAQLILDGVIKSNVADQRDHAMSLMCTAANSGCIKARAFLNAYCENDYRKHFSTDPSMKKSAGCLVDFDGKPIKIDCRGVLTPIDALLEFKDGSNILTLSTNVSFLCDGEIENSEKFKNAVFEGLRAWQGVYEVFGGQKVTVRVNVTNDDNFFDNLYVVPLTSDISESIQHINNVIGTKKKKNVVADVMANKRSFAINGLKWSVNSRKVIYLQSKSGKFNDYEEIFHVTKHEFGHALGLGDLYASAVDSLAGVKKGTYTELDSYAINDKYYNLVMCDHHGPISNNDIEMVILAFRENTMQLYQPCKLKGEISSALGKGN